MKRFIFISVFILTMPTQFFNCVFTQGNKINYLVSLTTPSFLEGKIPTYYSPGLEKRAMEYQELMHNVADFYEEKLGKEFDIKFALLDSSNWLSSIYPYGYMFYSKGWTVVPGDLNYHRLLRVLGIKSSANELEAALKVNDVTPDSLANIVVKLYTIHEVGHYYFGRLSPAKMPDTWSNELMASYFAWSYFAENEAQLLEPFELFCSVNSKYYEPKYKRLSDFVHLYAGMGLENYVWFHSNFFLLLKDIYDNQGMEFLSLVEREFPRTNDKEYTTDEAVEIFNRLSDGIVQKWKTELEN